MATKKEEEIKIPESVMNRANVAFRESALGSPFTERERTNFQGGYEGPSGGYIRGLPQFPFGGIQSTSLDLERPNFQASAANVQYERDAATRMANRYTFPVSGAIFGGRGESNPFGGRVQAFPSNSDPYRAASIESSNLGLSERTPSSPDVGAAGFKRGGYNYLGNSKTEQIVSPYGSATTTLSPQQVEQREQSRMQAEQMGTMPRTPEQQQALLAQMREKGAALGQQRVTDMEDFFTRKRAQQVELRRATSEAAKSGMDPMAVRAARRSILSQEPNTIAGIQEEARKITKMPIEDVVAPIRSAFGFSGGGPQPQSSIQAQPQGGFMASGIMPSFASTPLDFNRPLPSSSPTAMAMWRQQFDPFFKSQQAWLQRNLDRINS
jgi:hypothetical protein